MHLFSGLALVLKHDIRCINQLAVFAIKIHSQNNICIAGTAKKSLAVISSLNHQILRLSHVRSLLPSNFWNPIHIGLSNSMLFNLRLQVVIKRNLIG